MIPVTVTRRIAIFDQTDSRLPPSAGTRNFGESIGRVQDDSFQSTATRGAGLGSGREAAAVRLANNTEAEDEEQDPKMDDRGRRRQQQPLLVGPSPPSSSISRMVNSMPYFSD